MSSPVIDEAVRKPIDKRGGWLVDTHGSTRFLGWYPHRPGEVGDRRQRFIGERLGPIDQQPGPVALEEVQRLRADP